MFFFSAISHIPFSNKYRSETSTRENPSAFESCAAHSRKNMPRLLPRGSYPFVAVTASQIRNYLSFAYTNPVSQYYNVLTLFCQTENMSAFPVFANNLTIIFIVFRQLKLYTCPIKW